MQIDEALGAQAGAILLLNNLGNRSAEVSEFLNTATELEEIYGSESDVSVALMNASNMGPAIDKTIGRLRVMLETRTGYMIVAQRGKN